MKRILLCLTALAFSGCLARPAQQSMTETTPIAEAGPKASPTIDAKSMRDFQQEIRSMIFQLQQTITNTIQTTNYALDEQRAKVQSKWIRLGGLLLFALLGIFAGVALILLAAPSPETGKLKFLCYAAGFGLIVGAIAIPAALTLL